MYKLSPGSILNIIQNHPRGYQTVEKLLLETVQRAFLMVLRRFYAQYLCLFSGDWVFFYDLEFFSRVTYMGFGALDRWGSD